MIQNTYNKHCYSYKKQAKPLISQECKDVFWFGTSAIMLVICYILACML